MVGVLLRRPTFLAACGVASALVVNAAWLVAGLVEPMADWRDGALSDLGTLSTKHAWVWNVPLSVSGALLALFGVGVALALRAGVPGLLGGAALIVSGLGDFLDGFLRLDCAREERCGAARGSWHELVHDAESTVTVLALLAGMCVLALAFSRVAASRALAWLSVGAATLSASLAVTYALREGASWAGVLQRLYAGVAGTWVITVAWRVRSLSVGPDARFRERRGMA